MTVQALRREEMRERLVVQGMDPVGNAPLELASRISEEIAKWRRVVQASGAHVDWKGKANISGSG